MEIASHATIEAIFYSELEVTHQGHVEMVRVRGS